MAGLIEMVDLVLDTAALDSAEAGELTPLLEGDAAASRSAVPSHAGPGLSSFGNQAMESNRVFGGVLASSTIADGAIVVNDNYQNRKRRKRDYDADRAVTNIYRYIPVKYNIQHHMDFFDPLVATFKEIKLLAPIIEGTGSHQREGRHIQLKSVYICGQYLGQNRTNIGESYEISFHLVRKRDPQDLELLDFEGYGTSRLLNPSKGTVLRRITYSHTMTYRDINLHFPIPLDIWYSVDGTPNIEYSIVIIDDTVGVNVNHVPNITTLVEYHD